MEKITTVLKLITQKPNLIKNVMLDDEGHYFFSFNNISTWSILEDQKKQIELKLYIKEDLIISELINAIDKDDINTVIYKESELDETSTEFIKDLYLTVKEKVFGVNELLEKIIYEADLENDCLV